ncbi:hypothetical protein V2I01_40745 [Micromonospora sp. BRA006-A]|nr:hypothetical protein [Micromonospora sp. BRA006-A]
MALADVAHTLRVGRQVYAHRAAVVAGDPASAAAELRERRKGHRGVAEGAAPGWRSCSAVRARSTPGWAPSCTRRTAPTPPPSTSAPSCSAPSWAWTSAT